MCVTNQSRDIVISFGQDDWKFGLIVNRRASEAAADSDEAILAEKWIVHAQRRGFGSHLSSQVGSIDFACAKHALLGGTGASLDERKHQGLCLSGLACCDLQIHGGAIR